MKNNFDMDEILERLRARALHGMMTNDLLIDRFENTKNDDENVMFALQYLSKYEAPLKIHEESKSAEKATGFIEKANKNFSSAPWKSLCETYTKAVVHAPPDSSELARAYGNRSAVLYNGGLYKDSILDINRALNIGCLDKTKAKLYARKARCLLALDEKLTPDVEEAISEAREWVAKMDDTNKRYLDNILDNLITNSSMKKSFKNIDYRRLLPPTPKSNPKIMRASDAIEIKYSERYGRHVVATRDIEAGETLLVHKAYASIIEPKFLLKYCWNCSTRVWAGVPCHGCVAVIYCNETCRDMAWEEHHNIECPVIPAILQQKMVIRDLMALRLTVKAYKEAGTIEKLKQKLIKIDAVGDPITRSYTDGIFDDTKYASVYTLLKGSQFTFADAVRCAVVLYCLAATTEIFGKQMRNFRNLLDNQSAIFIGGLLSRHLKICLINTFAIRAVDDEGDRKIFEYGITMNPFINLYNHSCDPAASIIHVRNVHAVVTIQGIERGDQIFISYGPCFNMQPTDKRREIMKGFNFECRCKACMKNWGPHSLASFPQDEIPEPADLVTQWYPICQKIHNLSTRTADIANILTFASTLYRAMNMLQRVTKYPTQSMVHFKVSLMTLYAMISFEVL